VELSQREMQSLWWALTQYLPELRFEAARVKQVRHRHELVVNDEVLSALCERLEKALRSTATTEAAPGL
jgi:hypothetical protein